jgi:hypothetical protein
VLVALIAAIAGVGAVTAGSGAAHPARASSAGRAAPRAAAARPAPCAHFGRPALALDPRPHALRVFAIQLMQRPAQIRDAAAFRAAVDCALRLEVAPHLARGRANLVVFDEDAGLEALGAGPRAAGARRLLAAGVSGCTAFPCATVAVLGALNRGYARALRYLKARFPPLSTELGMSFVAATDTFVRVFMSTMAAEARRYGIYIVASNTQAPFALTRDPAAVAALRDPATPGVRAVYAPTAARAYDQAFLWGPRVVHRHAPAPLANLIAVNRKTPLTAFETTLGFAPGPSGGAAAIANLRPVTIPGTGARLGFATSLPAFVYGPPVLGRHACDDVTVSYMRCLDHLGANVLIQADANDGAWTGADGSDQAEHWQPLSWMGSAWRAVSDPTVHFAYAVNAMLVGNLADTPFDGQSAILQRGRRRAGCHYIGNARFIPRQDDPGLRSFAGPKAQFLALAPWVVPDAPRARLSALGVALASGRTVHAYVQTALIADLPFPLDRVRPGCRVAGR